MRPESDRHERIDLIDVDPEVFVDSAPRQPRPEERRRQAVKGVGVVAVIAVVALFWWPRTPPPEWQVFQPAVVPAAGMTEELIFDDPPGILVTADLGPRPSDVKPELGYVFAEPGGTMLTRRWASFRAKSTNLPDALVPADVDVENVANVDDVPVDVRRVRVRHYLEWGPLDGHTWSATTNLFDEDEAIEFANHVAIIEGQPALAHRYDLDDMQPVGSTAALDCVVMLTSLLGGDRLLGPVMPTLLTWAPPAEPGQLQTLEGGVSLASIAAPADALPLVEFVLGAGQSTTVHGQPAVLISSKSLGPVVAWLEDGRLIMVEGDVPPAELIFLAESVRPATSGEWRVVVRTDIRNDGGITFNVGDGVIIFEGIDSSTGDGLALTVQVVEDQVLVCLEVRPKTRSDSTVCDASLGVVELPLLRTIDLNGQRFLIAMAASEAEVHIKLADKTSTYPLEDFGPTLPGLTVATLLPTEYGVVQLVAGGEVIAAI
ncbi:MAG: hypothetical protein ABL953_03060 [Ilumatobacteraceae bacterium]